MTDTDDWPAVAAAGAYAPRGRLPTGAIEEAWGTLSASGVESVAVPAADEDALTMAVAAARRALSAAGVDGPDLRSVGFAASTPPNAEEDPTARLGAMLSVPDDATRQAFASSTRAGTRALRAVAEAGGTPALVVAADVPRGEPADSFGQAAGAGAAAFVLREDGPVRIRGFAEHASPYPGTRFRETGSERTEGLGVTSYDREAFRETLSAAVDGLDDPDPDAAAVQSPDGALPYRAAGALGLDSETVNAGTTVHEIGDTGAASVPLGIATALAEGAETVLAAAYGSGAGADAAVLSASGSVPVDLAPGVVGEGTTELSYAEALRRRGEITPDPPEGGGAYVSIPSWRRSLPQRYRLEAGRCPDCGALAFPPEGACPDCAGLVEFEAVELPETGTVEAVTTIGHGGAPPEFAPQQARGGAFGVAVVAFEAGGETASAPVQVAGDHPTPAVGDRVVATVRRIYTQEGVTRYGTKVRPIES
jgi:hydroxymethylglutaryl-CoA synthase